VTDSARGTAGTWSGVAGQDGTGKILAADARFETGSIGKTVVAAEILRLVEQGRLDLDDPAADHFGPDVRRDTNGATVRDLLRMRSGLTNGQPPGTRFEYSNGDYVLLGLVLEGVEGRPLGDVLTQDILKVPGAEGLTFPAGGTVENAAGPLETDPLSLARWGYELFGGDILTDESLASMVAFTEDGYGMGAFDFSVDFGVPAAGHLGQEDAWSAGLVALPDRQTVFVALMNSSDVERTLRILTQLAAVPID
jgi:D-alanyl-D-alanine carboxypeptidase